MKTFPSKTIARLCLSAAAASLATAMMAGCVSAGEQRRADLDQDRGTCADYGAQPGSAGYTRCMLQQQQRRDHEQLLNAERGRISAETARNNLETLRLIRKNREDRKNDD
ncbi:Uncharacterised protein [Bordetella ansorpii]|uniref:Lipoprotein n=1 Tax=Bordetella ansorpii TaxID=288768 RepID=A0A157SVC5_9BORD|nr:hypothetical protein [Bordetella ansorpii]SAI74412.1 Uncharacterised protein [Bordetella ansorpii]